MTTAVQGVKPPRYILQISDLKDNGFMDYCKHLSLRHNPEPTNSETEIQ
jgi:hypothetical protein